MAMSVRTFCPGGLSLSMFILAAACAKPVQVAPSPVASAPTPVPAVVETKAASPSVIVDRSAVQFVQRMLASLGYEIGNLDGVAGPATRRAVLAFQKDQKLTQDGLITGPLIEKLKVIQASLPKATTVSVTPGDALFFSDGSTEVVKEERVLQWAQRSGKTSLVAVRPSTSTWPSAARAGLDWATSHALDLNNGAATFWTSTGVEQRFEIRTLALSQQETALLGEQAARCRRYELRTYLPQRGYPAMACADKAGNWFVGLSKVQIARPASSVGKESQLNPASKKSSAFKR